MSRYSFSDVDSHGDLKLQFAWPPLNRRVEDDTIRNDVATITKARLSLPSSSSPRHHPRAAASLGSPPRSAPPSSPAGSPPGSSGWSPWTMAIPLTLSVLRHSNDPSLLVQRRHRERSPAEGRKVRFVFRHREVTIVPMRAVLHGPRPDALPTHEGRVPPHSGREPDRPPPPAATRVSTRMARANAIAGPGKLAGRDSQAGPSCQFASARLA